MKKECEWTRKKLPAYLRGHVFRTTRSRIERHLNSCALCKSEFEALKRSEETRLILQDFSPSGGVLQRVKTGISFLARLKKIVYRPLWIAALLLVAAAVSYYVIVPSQFDIELEKLAKTASPTPARQKTVSPEPEASPAVQTAPSTTGALPAPLPAVETMTITITIPQENEHAAIMRINEIMKEYVQLQTSAFSDTVREISSSLTAKELLTFFSAIEPEFKIGHSGKRIASFPSAQSIPFVLRLKSLPTVPRTSESTVPTSTRSVAH
jgi:hypothetical protein